VPDGLSLRELLIAAEAAWEPHAALLALTANVNRDPKRRPRPFAADEFNPFAEPDRRASPRGGIPITAENIDILKAVFCGGTGKKKRGVSSDS